VYIVSFRTHDDRRPSKFIVLADNMKSAIKKAWEHGGAFASTNPPDKLMICVIFLSQDQDKKGIKFLAASPHRTETYESSW
jgi:hypothetical protein